MANLAELNLENSLKSSMNNQNVAFGLFNKLEDQYQTKLDHLSAQQTLLKNYQDIALFDKDKQNKKDRKEKKDFIHTINRKLVINEMETRKRGSIYFILKLVLLFFSLISLALLVMKNR